MSGKLFRTELQLHAEEILHEVSIFDNNVNSFILTTVSILPQTARLPFHTAYLMHFRFD